MPWFALHSDPVEYEPAPGVRLVTARPTLRVEIGWQHWLRPHSIVDTGAPFSVISHTVATSIGARLTPIPVPNDPIPFWEGGKAAAPVPASQLLTWNDPISRTPIPCLVAEIGVRLRSGSRVSDPLRLVAKVLQQPARPYNDQFVLFGVHLLTANAGQLHLEGLPWNLGGPGLFFPP